MHTKLCMICWGIVFNSSLFAKQKSSIENWFFRWHWKTCYDSFACEYHINLDVRWWTVHFWNKYFPAKWWSYSPSNQQQHTKLMDVICRWNMFVYHFVILRVANIPIHLHDVELNEIDFPWFVHHFVNSGAPNAFYSIYMYKFRNMLRRSVNYI